MPGSPGCLRRSSRMAILTNLGADSQGCWSATSIDEDLSPYFSPVIYCRAKYADAHSGNEIIPERVPIFGVFLNSLITSEPKAERRKPRSGASEHSADYASFAQTGKTPNLTTSSAPRDENW